MSIFAGIFFILHALVHLLYAGQALRFFELRPGLIWPDGAWLFLRLLGDPSTRWLAAVSLALAFLIFATLMRRSPHFGRALAYIGMVTFAIGTFFWISGIGVILLFLNMLGSVPWSILLARAFFRLVRGGMTA